MGWGKNPALLMIDGMPAFADPTQPLGFDPDQEWSAIVRISVPARRVKVPIYESANSYDDQNSRDA
ncbi:MAG: hypothetical protein GY768_08030 [Planctomycetaceae bacterium]|nr:hypothetical protein [Planctomycetaceae bacterium]